MYTYLQLDVVRSLRFYQDLDTCNYPQKDLNGSVLLKFFLALLIVPHVVFFEDLFFIKRRVGEERWGIKGRLQ